MIPPSPADRLSPKRWLLARYLALASILPALASPAAGQLSVTRTPAIASADLGKVAAGTVATTFTVEPWSSTLNRSPDSTTGFLRFDSAPLSLPSVTVSCTAASCVGQANQVQIRIQRVSSDSRITLDKWTAGALTYVSGYETQAQSGTSDMTWKVQFNTTSSSVTFNIGQMMTIGTGTGSGNTLDLTYRVTAGVGTAPGSGGVTGIVRTILYRPISITKNTNLIFGQVKRPPSGTGHVIVSPASPASRSTDGGVSLITDTSVSAAKFTTSGEGAASITVSIPGSITLYGSRGGSMTLVPSGAGTGSTSLSGSAGSAGTKVSYVGGSLEIESNDPTGNYTGTMTVTSTYN